MVLVCLGQTEDKLERLSVLADLEMPWDPPSGAGGSEEECLGFSSETADPTTQTRISSGKWNGVKWKKNETERNASPLPL